MARVLSVVQTEQTAIRPPGTFVGKLAITSRTCAYCGSTEIRPSDRRNALDILLACSFLAPYRCRVCRQRFYRLWRPSLQSPPDPPIAPLLLMPARRDPSAIDPPQPSSIESPVAERDVPKRKSVEIHSLPPQPILAVLPGPVLIFESDLSIRKLLRRLLERRGYFIVELAQADELARELRDRRAGLLIVDAAAMGANGVEALVALARAHPSLKILALSTDSFEGHEIPGRLLALPKPFPLDRFVDCVDRLLQRSIATTAGL
jgi:CheY-like chemotaxis protein